MFLLWSFWSPALRVENLVIVLSCKRKISTMAHVGGRLKCLPQPNRNVWSGALSRAQWGRVSTVLLKAQWGTALSKAQWGMGTVEGTTLHSTGALSRAANTDSADSFASPSFPLFSASSSSYNMFWIAVVYFESHSNNQGFAKRWTLATGVGVRKRLQSNIIEIKFH